MEKQLPTIVIEGTVFAVDVSKQELREVENPANTISFLEMEDHGSHYTLRYDADVKNLPEVLMKSVPQVDIPQMVHLDPEGMAAHHGVNLEEVRKRTDFDIIVNQDLVALREKGALPVIEIAGHPFYVDLRMDCLRPKDDFSTSGIHFSEIDHFFIENENLYLIPYHPDTKLFIDLDFDEIMAIPKDVVLVEIPHPSRLDPVGYARKYGIDQKELLRAYPPVAEMKARIVPWKETPIDEIIARNLEKVRGLNMYTQQKGAERKGRRL